MTTDATKQSLYDEVTQALDDYRLELADILDHVSDEQEIQSYGHKADQLHDLRCRWLRHTKDQDHNEYTISIRDQDGKLRNDYDLVCAPPRSPRHRRRPPLPGPYRPGRPLPHISHGENRPTI